MQSDVDARQHQLFADGLRELGYDAADFSVEIRPKPFGSEDVSRPMSVFPAMSRKTVTVHRLSTDRVHELETYVGEGWAGELLQALLNGRLNP